MKTSTIPAFYNAWLNLFFILALLALSFASGANVQTIHYVKQIATGNGSSRNHASGDLQSVVKASFRLEIRFG